MKPSKVFELTKSTLIIGAFLFTFIRGGYVCLTQGYNSSRSFDGFCFALFALTIGLVIIIGFFAFIFEGIPWILRRADREWEEVNKVNDNSHEL